MADAPRYLATVGRQGYRFLVGDDREATPPLLARPLVGRQGEVETLQSWFQRAAQGARQFVLVSGEAGVGKTTVVDRWLAQLAAGRGVRIACGQCVEHYGEEEPYLPLLEALGQLSRGPHHREVLDAVRRYAPMWLVQLPGLLPETALQRLQRQLQGATAARMLRELADVRDVLTAESPLVLVFEDLHWSDRPTVEALAYVAQRRAPARLLVLGTYRPVKAAIQQHPLRRIVQELCGRGHAVELRLELLTSENVRAYVTGRLGGSVSAQLAAFVYERTEGHALFLVNIVDHLVGQGVVVRREGQWTLQDGVEAKVASLPEGLRQLLVRRLEGLPAEGRRVLEAASVAGEQFTVAAVAAAAQCPMEDVEASCEGLAAQRHFLDDIGLREWSDGTSSGRLSDTVPFPPETLRGGFVRGVTPRTALARVLWTLGYADQAQQRSQEALVLARQGGHLPSLAYAECFVGLVYQCRRDVVATQTHGDALLALAAAHSWPLRAEQGRILRGWALAMHGAASAGVALLRQALDSPHVGPENLRPHWLALLAEAYVEAGQPEAGLTVLDEAFTRVATTEARWWEAELSRLKGVLLLQLPRPEVSRAEASFLQALEVARRQEAKALELRAA